jgi:hypothetical protein
MGELLNCWAPLAHSCKPSYLGGRDQEGHGSKPVPVNGLRDPISRIPYPTPKKEWNLNSWLTYLHCILFYFRFKLTLLLTDA